MGNTLAVSRSRQTSGRDFSIDLDGANRNLSWDLDSSQHRFCAFVGNFHCADDGRLSHLHRADDDEGLFGLHTQRSHRLAKIVDLRPGRVLGFRGLGLSTIFWVQTATNTWQLLSWFTINGNEILWCHMTWRHKVVSAACLLFLTIEVFVKLRELPHMNTRLTILRTAIIPTQTPIHQ